MTSYTRRFKSDPRPAWKRTTPSRNPIGALVQAPAPKQPQTAAAYGRQCERDTIRSLRKDGWTVTQSHLSRGGADLVASRVERGVVRTIAVQVKSTTTFTGSRFNQGLKEVLTHPPVDSREVWAYVKGYGHVATIHVRPDGAVSVTGKARFVDAIRLALARRRT